MNRLESEYRATKDEDNAIKVRDEADTFVDQADCDTSQGRAAFASLAKAQSRPRSVADSQVSERRREKEPKSRPVCERNALRRESEGNDKKKQTNRN